MKKLILMISAVFVCTMTFAQAPAGILTIFSEDSHKFFLTLNGQKQNDKAETNIRVENLTQPFYSCKIIFEDQSLGEISKSITINGGMDQAPGDVTYKLKAGKDGKQVLRYFTYAPIIPNSPPARPDGVVVYSFGVTTPIVTTTSVTTETVNANATISGNGTGLNVNVTVPNGAVTTTTTTTSSSSSSSSMSSGTVSSGCNGYGMAPGDFQSAKATITKASFENTKLSTAKEIAGANCLYAEQIAGICRLFGFENTKLDFAKYAYKRCIDPQNYFKVNNVFDFDSSKTELSKFTGQ